MGDGKSKARAESIRHEPVLARNMPFEIVGEITDVEIIAVGSAVRGVARLRRLYGPGRWRKLKELLPSVSAVVDYV